MTHLEYKMAASLLEETYLEGSITSNEYHTGLIKLNVGMIRIPERLYTFINDKLFVTSKN